MLSKIHFSEKLFWTRVIANIQFLRDPDRRNHVSAVQLYHRVDELKRERRERLVNEILLKTIIAIR